MLTVPPALSRAVAAKQQEVERRRGLSVRNSLGAHAAGDGFVIEAIKKGYSQTRLDELDRVFAEQERG